jgi:hypothetical protein
MHIKRDDGFPLALEVGAGVGILHRLICSDDVVLVVWEALAAFVSWCS